MNTKINNENSASPTLTGVILTSTQKLASQIERVKHNILAEFREAFEAHNHLLRHAINQADALAWQTAYPELVFPTLAIEKVQAAAGWAARQKSYSKETLAAQHLSE
jgi:hypothetical protein